MPAGDGTGPAGSGPMTGRAAGYCAGFDVPGFANPAPGRGRGMGFGWGRGGGRGRGWRHQFYATGMPGWLRGSWAPPAGPAAQVSAPPVTQEVQMLKEQAQRLENALAGIQKRISDLETPAAETQG